MGKGTTKRFDDAEQHENHNGDICVKFGSYKVEAPIPKKSKVNRNVKIGQVALARAMSKIVKPGVKIDAAKGIPLFHVESEHPGQIVRELDGKRAIGKFIKGRFKISR